MRGCGRGTFAAKFNGHGIVGAFRLPVHPMVIRCPPPRFFFTFPIWMERYSLPVCRCVFGDRCWRCAAFAHGWVRRHESKWIWPRFPPHPPYPAGRPWRPHPPAGIRFIAWCTTGGRVVGGLVIPAFSFDGSSGPRRQGWPPAARWRAY